MAFTENVNGYLTRLASRAVIGSTEKVSLGLSVRALKQRLEAYFGAEISEHLLFGSYKRETILPRTMDTHSDVDYMIIFSNGDYQPQTYLDQLRRFVNRYYSSSEIAQSHPTIQLKLGHICIELVPATKDWFGGLKIPAKASSYMSWIDTDPNGFNASLVSKNQECSQLIKPLVRIVKYWNACNLYPYESFQLEQYVVAQQYLSWSLFDTSPITLRDCFYICINNLSLGWDAPQWKQQKISRAKQIVNSATLYESQCFSTEAVNEIKKLLPVI